MIPRMGGHRAIGAAAYLIALLVFSHHALANGYYKSTVAHPAPPGIPVQRAMIAYRDGVQTLIVESAYQTNSPEVGWILPLPAEPTKLESADPNLLASLSRNLQPHAVARVKSARDTMWVIFVFVLLASAIAVFSTQRTRFLSILVGMVLLFLAVSIMLPSLSRSISSGSVELLSPVERVGNYDVQVLRAERIAALTNWLAESGLEPVSDAEQAVFDDYIRRGWCFAVAKLTRDADGNPATPHPIAATFPAAEPVFPMRATSLAGSRTLVELFVVSDSIASADGFECVLADRFVPDAPPAFYGAPVAPSLKAGSYDAWIGHPDAVRRISSGAVLTKLAATLTPGEMNEDVRITLTPWTEARRQVLYSARARRDLIIAVLLAGATLLVGLAAHAFERRRRPARGDFIALGAVVLVTLAGAGYVYASTPVTAVVETSRGQAVFDRRDLADQVKRIAKAAQEAGSISALEGFDAQRLLGENVFTKQPIRRERSPGNYDIREIDGKMMICLYDRWSREIRIPVGNDAMTKPE